MKGDPDHARSPSDPEPAADPSATLPDHVADQVVRITAAMARAKGLPPLGFSLDFTDTTFTVSPFVEGSYLYASGPPGGPLGIGVRAIAREASFVGVAGDDASEQVAEQVELLGESRRALAWISGASMARRSNCAILVAPPEGDQALLIELNVGHQGPEVTCKTTLDNPALAKVLASLAFE